MKVALVYDRVNKIGGAERVLMALHEIWPEAPLYTSVYNPQTAQWAKDFAVRTSFLQKFPLARTRHELYPWLMPLAFETFDFSEYDLVISLTSEFAKSIITTPKTLHICYCFTATRYLWSGYRDYFQNKWLKFLSLPLVAYLRKWDQISAQRPDIYVATCENVKARIEKYYRRKAKVIYPPININKQITNKQISKSINKFLISNNKKSFLVVSRLVSYKKIDIAIKAFNQLKWPLKIIGIGNEMKHLKAIAKNNIDFLGELTDSQLISYYQQCQAVIYPQEEDFGLVPLEAQSFGKPVIAYKSGGALETLIPGKTGEFFHPQTAEALIMVLKKFNKLHYKEKDCRKNAQKFNKEKFKKEIKKLVETQNFASLQNL